MCTVSVIRIDQRVLVTMNRDDKPQRDEAPPTIRRDNAPLFIAPTDLAAKGTWIAVNACGVVACLLNRYDQAPAGTVSRGHIVPAVMNSSDLASAIEHFGKFDCRSYSPFTCLVIRRDKIARFDWTGSKLTSETIALADAYMATSSSWNEQTVRNSREALFSQTQADLSSTEDALEAFHCGHTPDDDAWKPMMLRQASRTKSITQIDIKPGTAMMRYWRRETALAHGLQMPDAELVMATEV